MATTPRAAVRLVELGELHIPAVRTVLEMAAAARTRNAEVYLALTKIYSEDVHRIEEAVRVSRKSVEPEIRPRIPAEAGEPEPQRRHYARAMGDRFRYDLFSESESEPLVKRFVAPYYPLELTEKKVSGEVVVDVQVTGQGDVGGMWLISAMPDVFATLATAAIRDWKFQ